jgi:hypothetical protein
MNVTRFYVAALTIAMVFFAVTLVLEASRVGRLTAEAAAADSASLTCSVKVNELTKLHDKQVSELKTCKGHSAEEEMVMRVCVAKAIERIGERHGTAMPESCEWKLQQANGFIDLMLKLYGPPDGGSP